MEIEYKLAQELKNAGFPQKETGTIVFKKGISLADSQKKWNENSAYSPTLSELIGACEEINPMFMLITSGNGWVARIDDAIVEKGKTPLEAVARLWLALNKK